MEQVPQKPKNAFDQPDAKDFRFPQPELQIIPVQPEIDKEKKNEIDIGLLNDLIEKLPDDEDENPKEKPPTIH